LSKIEISEFYEVANLFRLSAPYYRQNVNFSRLSRFVDEENYGSRLSRRILRLHEERIDQKYILPKSVNPTVVSISERPKESILTIYPNPNN